MTEEIIDEPISQQEKIEGDLNSKFPFACLWQDGEEQSIIRYVPLLNAVFLLILIVIVLMK